MSKDKELQITTLFLASKSLPIESQKTEFERYELESIPIEKEDLNDSRENMLLKYIDKWDENQMASNSIIESKYVISLLSLFFRMNANYSATKINFIHEIKLYKNENYFSGMIDIPNELGSIFQMINSIDMKLARQIVRSCQMYQTSISLFEKNFTLAFFLLVTSIECLSDVIYKNMSKKQKFKKFILEYLPNNIKKEEYKDKNLFIELLNEAYKIRSGFTHGGKQIQIISYTSNITGKYVKHYVNKKEVKTPRISWFEQIVSGVIFEFIKRQKRGDNKNNLSKLALEESVVYLKARRPLEAGELLSEKDVYIRD